MTTPTAYAGTRHLRLACVRAIAENLAGEFGTGGSFENDETQPTRLPELVQTWGGPYNSVPTSGAIYPYAPEDEAIQGRMPWVCLELIEQNGAEDIDDFRGRTLLLDVQVRSRVSVDHSPLNGPAIAKATARMAAESLTQCAMFCIMKYVGVTARTIDPTNAFSIQAGGFIGNVSSYASAQIAQTDGANATSFDAIGSIGVTLRLREIGGTPGG